jgi:hypothetical protein
MTSTNDATDEFDRWLSRSGVQKQTFLRDASVDSRDTLEGCWHAVRSIFGDNATPELALTMLPIVLRRADEARRQRRDEIEARTTDES